MLFIGLFRYAIVHSGSPLAYWGVSECVETWRKHIIPDDCEPGSSYIAKTSTYEELMLRSIHDKRFLRLDGEVNTKLIFVKVIVI